MTVLEHVGVATSQLVRAGLPHDLAAFDAELLARHVLGWDRTAFVAHRQSVAPEMFAGEYASVLRRRLRHEPVSLIVGRREFWGLDFEVTRAVLTPRPETELIVEETLTLVGRTDTPRHLVDVGTGSGCVAIALACELPHVEVSATDVSAEALEVARRNAARHGVADRVCWVHGSYLDGVSTPADIIVANPPYIPDGDVGTLPSEVREYEPHAALAGGPDGLDAVRGLLEAATARLRPGGYMVMEFGIGQDAAVRDCLTAHPGFSVCKVRQDLQGIPRTIVIQYR